MSQEQDPLTDRVRAEVGVRDLVARTTRAWNEGSAQDYGRCFTADAWHVFIDGTHYAGREAIERLHQEVRSTPGWPRAMLKMVRITHPARGVASVMLEGVGLAPGEKEGLYWLGTATAVLEPDGVWRYASAHNTQLAVGSRSWFADAWKMLVG